MGSDQTSVTYLERRADVLYYDEYWRIRGELQNFQTIDISVPDDCVRPYSRVPRMQAERAVPVRDSHFEFALNAEAVNFLRASVVDAPARRPNADRPALDVSPELRWSEPRGRVLLRAGRGLRLHPVRSAQCRARPAEHADPRAALRPPGHRTGVRTRRRLRWASARRPWSRAWSTATCPYRNQDELPIFDTALPDLNLTELFRTNRYVGYDRIGDANQLALGLTTRLFDTCQRHPVPVRHHRPNPLFLDSAGDRPAGRFAVGQRPARRRAARGQSAGLAGAVRYQCALRRHSAARADLCHLGWPDWRRDRSGRERPALSGLGHRRRSRADRLQAPERQSRTINGIRTPPHTDKEEIGVQYQPDPTRVVNLGYRFQEGILKQYDASFAWPIAGHWNTVGRWVYSLADQPDHRASGWI